MAYIEEKPANLQASLVVVTQAGRTALGGVSKMPDARALQQQLCDVRNNCNHSPHGGIHDHELVANQHIIIIIALKCW